MKKGILYIVAGVALFNTYATAQTNQLPIEEFKLKNGLEVKMIHFGTIPAVTISCYVNVGKKTETPGQQNLASMTSDGLLLGNEKHTRIEQDGMLAKLGSGISASANDNYTELSMRFLNKDAATAMELFSSTILKPTFPADEIKEQVEQTLNYNNPYKMDIGDLASMFSDYSVYGTANPLGRHFYAAQLNKVTAAQLLEFYKFNYTPKNTKLVLAGNFDNAQMKAMIENLFGSWSAAYGENNGAAYETENISKKEYFFVNKNRATQTCLQWNKKAPEGGSKDAILFELANECFNTLLFAEIRAKEGKTYGINSRYSEANNNGIYTVSTQVRNDVAFETTVSFDRVIKQFYDSGITQANLDKAKAALKNRRLAIESPGSIIEFYNPILYKDVNKRNEYLASIDAMTLEQVNKIVKKYFTPDSYKLVMVGDATVLDPQLQKITGLVKLPVTSIEKDN
ncbi:MAG: peptidase [Bacteroidetes bacterium]|nr:peptidase [Bacteroidota bacterium]